MTKRGLWILGERIGRDRDHILSLLKYALVPKPDWDRPEFQSGDLDQVFALVDPMSSQIVSAMIDDHLPHEFADIDGLCGNIAFRKAVVAILRDITSKIRDADYREPYVVIPPTIGYLETLEVMWAPGAATGQGLLGDPLPFMPPDASWRHIDTGSPWHRPKRSTKSRTPTPNRAFMSAPCCAIPSLGLGLHRSLIWAMIFRRSLRTDRSATSWKASVCHPEVGRPTGTQTSHQGIS